MSTPVLQLTGITKRFPGITALDCVSVSFYPGEIHAIVGENGAGKSTLINILAGEHQPDAGEIRFNGQPVKISNALVSQQLGISAVYQELALCPNLSIAENISLHSVARRNPVQLANRRQMRDLAEQALAELGVRNVDVTRPVSHVSVAVQQLVEIAKTISREVKVLILDEPNSALTQEETEHLFDILRKLRSQGVTILYVSHRLEEVLSLSDRISVLRDGKHVATFDANECTVDALIEKMVGRSVDALYHRRIETQPQEAVALAVNRLSSDERVRDVSFHVHAGEIVGVAGLPDSGKDELIECLFGLRTRDSGETRIKDHPALITSPGEAISHGLVLIPADRRGAGALLLMNIQQNIVASSLERASAFGALNPSQVSSISRDYAAQMDVRMTGLTQQMATLSGGNQQKVILSRGLATQPSILLLHEPTRGIDVGAKAEIYAILQRLAREGAAILIVSSELPELMGQCDRILVMHLGRVTGEFTRDEFNQERILACAMGETRAV